MERIRRSYRQFVKFSIIGAIVTGMHLAIMFALTELFGVHYILSSVFGFLVANITSYRLNKSWTFSDPTHSKTQYLKFLIVSIIAISVNLLILYVLTEQFRLYYMVSQVFAILGSLVINFTLNKFITFKG